MYKDMSVAEGRRYLKNVWNLIFKPLADDDFFVEPWEYRELGDCAMFRLDTGIVQDEVFFFVTDMEVISFLKETKGELYLFGAYNQINVCQMRARGVVTLEVEHPDINRIKQCLHEAIESRIGKSVDRLDKKEADERYYVLENGLPFRFQISSYAYSMYERG